VDGILNINKPAGLTSFSVVSRIKRICGERHAGHAGTLDPIATGVLPVCLGRATRLVEFIQNGHKTYRTEVQLGITTDTYDTDGKVVSRRDASQITRTQIESVLTQFRGDILQTPPIYSAIKQNGQPLYKLSPSCL